MSNSVPQVVLSHARTGPVETGGRIAAAIQDWLQQCGRSVVFFYPEHSDSRQLAPADIATGTSILAILHTGGENPEWAILKTHCETVGVPYLLVTDGIAPALPNAICLTGAEHRAGEICDLLSLWGEISSGAFCVRDFSAAWNKLPATVKERQAISASGIIGHLAAVVLTWQTFLILFSDSGDFQEARLEFPEVVDSGRDFESLWMTLVSGHIFRTTEIDHNLNELLAATNAPSFSDDEWGILDSFSAIISKHKQKDIDGNVFSRLLADAKTSVSVRGIHSCQGR